MTAFEAIRYEVQAGVAIIRLVRPDRANALSRPVMSELHAAFDLARDDDAVGAVLLIGSGTAFCAGADLKGGGGVPITELDLGESMDRFMNPLVRRIRELPKAVVAGVNGVAAGAGCNLALSCDIVIAARSARFVENFARIGLVPDGGGSYLLPRLIGVARARGVALLAEPVNAQTALDWGMIWALADDDALEHEAVSLAQRLAAMPPQAQGAIKQLLQASERNRYDDQLDLERDFQREAGRSEEFREAVAAFQQRRPPVFRRTPESG